VQLFNRSSTVETPRAANTPQGIRFLITRGRTGAQAKGSASVIAFTAANSGAGVSHVVRSLAAQLARQTHEPTLIVDAERLTSLHVADLIDLRARCARTNVANLWVLRKQPPVNGNGNGHKPSPGSEVAGEVDCVRALRSNFKHTLIDCPSINASTEAPWLAPQVDGVVLVVEADRTRRNQILHARQTIEMADGKLLALVLNKRRHLVPEWLYRML
jgi:Mrp family chromosome partitioning ATPase